MPKPDSNRVALMQGTLDMLVLRSLLLGPAHGHAIVKLIQQLSDAGFMVGANPDAARLWQTRGRRADRKWRSAGVAGK